MTIKIQTQGKPSRTLVLNSRAFRAGYGQERRAGHRAGHRADKEQEKCQRMINALRAPSFSLTALA